MVALGHQAETSIDFDQDMIVISQDNGGTDGSDMVLLNPANIDAFIAALIKVRDENRDA